MARIQRAGGHDAGQAVNTRLRSATTKIVAFTRLEVHSDMKLMESACPMQPKAPRSEDLSDNVSALTSATCQSFPNRSGAEPSSGEKDKQADRLTALELPDIPEDGSTLGYSMVKQNGEGKLRQLMEGEEEEPLPNVPNLCSCWEIPSETIENKTVKETGEGMKLPVAPMTGLWRMQCSWTELFRSGESFLYDDSCNLLKRMIRANTQLVMFKNDTVVPNVFGSGWWRPFYDIQRYESLAECGGELQQLLLPSDLVRDDEAKLADAPAKIVSLADRNLRCLRRSDVSLTRASMNIPSVWNFEITTDRIAILIAEKLTTLAPQPTPTPPTVQIGKTQLQVPEKTEVSGLRLNSPTDWQKSSLNTQICSDGQGIAMLPDQPQTATAKLKVVAEDKPLSTDYFVSDKFLKCSWSEPQKEGNDSDVREGKRLKDDQLLQQFARPAMWDLMRKKLLKVDGASFAHALDGVSFEALKAIIYQQLPKVKQMSLNPSAFSNGEIIEVCTSLRQAVWLHTLRIMSGCRSSEAMSAILTRILPSTKYRIALGSSNWKDLRTLVQAIAGNVMPSDALIEYPVDTSAVEENSTLQPPTKKHRVLPTNKENIPVRVMCSIEFLEQDKLLDELCTEQQIFFIERDLPPPIDVLVDERNCICVVDETTIQEEASMRRFIFSLAHLQVQQRKCWIVVALSNPISPEMEELLNLFLAAFVQFRIEIQVLTSFSCEETGRFVRAIVDECAEVALNDYRILPRLWFERPFLLEEESQLERFLVSTKVVNHYAAQSLLHKICVEDLFSKSLDELKLLVQNAVADDQLELLWRLVQHNHGLDQT
ncbi:hypothetical protein V7S43_010976 [Phytophthora oleae]|uniref:Uncharacterized protein n=1 Tax=Phytophthora oleae TaxID=2107226 RepID=A0ABD3FEG3_9STRA